MSKYGSVQEATKAMNEYLEEKVGNGDFVIAVSIVPISSECTDDGDYEDILLPGATHNLRVASSTRENGEIYTSNIMGEIFPAILHDDGSITIADIDEVFGGGPMLQDVCVGRALEWLSKDGGIITDIEEGWRKWPSKDLWYGIGHYTMDYSSNFDECPYCTIQGTECWDVNCVIRGFNMTDSRRHI